MGASTANCCWRVRKCRESRVGSDEHCVSGTLGLLCAVSSSSSPSGACNDQRAKKNGELCFV